MVGAPPPPLPHPPTTLHSKFMFCAWLIRLQRILCQQPWLKISQSSQREGTVYRDTRTQGHSVQGHKDTRAQWQKGLETTRPECNRTKCAQAPGHMATRDQGHQSTGHQGTGPPGHRATGTRGTRVQVTRDQGHQGLCAPGHQGHQGLGAPEARCTRAMGTMDQGSVGTKDQGHQGTGTGGTNTQLLRSRYFLKEFGYSFYMQKLNDLCLSDERMSAWKFHGNVIMKSPWKFFIMKNPIKCHHEEFI